MKLSVLVSAAALAITLSASAGAREPAAVRACVKSFVENNLEGRNVVVRLESDASQYSILYRRPISAVKFVAVSKETGKVVASAKCTINKDTVTLEDVKQSELLAAR